MLRKPLLPLATLLGLAACETHPAGIEKQPVPPGPTPAATAQCYGYATAQGDTVQLRLKATEPAAVGTLRYHYAGKDLNQGTISGAFRGDTLRADYLFRSEGLQSVREVVFVRRGQGLVEGYGPVADSAGKVRFRHPRHLTFDGSTVLAPVPCR